MSDLSRLLDDVYGSATVTSLTSDAARSAVATVPMAPPAPPAEVALPDPAPLPPGPDPAELLEGFFDLGIDGGLDGGIDDADGLWNREAPHEEPEATGAGPATRWQPGDDDILPPRSGRRLALRLRRG